MKKTLTIAVSAALLILASAAFATVPDFTMYGFPNVIASVNLQPSQSAILTVGNAQVIIPAGAFGKDPARFQLLTATPSSWQPYAPSGEKVLYAFAFRVTDLTTGKLIGKFSEPLIFRFSSGAVTANAEYLDVTPSFAVSENPIPPKIKIFGPEGGYSIGSLSHPIAGAPVGWLVTVPE